MHLVTYLYLISIYLISILFFEAFTGILDHYSFGPYSVSVILNCTIQVVKMNLYSFYVVFATVMGCAKRVNLSKPLP